MNRKNGKRGADARLVIVSNRLPITLEKRARGWVVTPSIGGLVSAIAPVLRNRGGMWIGWTGVPGEPNVGKALEEGTRASGYRLVPVALSVEEHQKYYYGFSNEILWPLFHDLENLCNFDPEYWTAYRSVNARFAEALHAQVTEDDYVWIHDYHLFLAAGEARRRGVTARMGFFLHIPFPPLDVYVKLPWRHDLLEALFEYDLIGLQSLRDRRNLLQCLRGLLKDIEVEGHGPIVTVRAGDRTVRLGVFPIGIDAKGTVEEARQETVTRRAEEIRSLYPNQRIIVGLDRLDYTKGIPERLRAYRLALERNPYLHGTVTLFQVVAPSREELPEYEDLRDEIDRMVGQINGQFSRPGWVPIQYFGHRVSREDVLAFFRAAHVALITPLKDGMNLVAKEFAACRLDGDGVIVLSEFAGAAPQMQRGVVLVNPTDSEGVADALVRALDMPLDEQRRRMRLLRRGVERDHVGRWVEQFLDVAFSKNLEDFPFVEDYAPRVRMRVT